MKPYQKQNRPRRSAFWPETRAVPPASGPPPVVVHRYVHPIRTNRAVPQTTAEDLLVEIREALTQQTEKLDVILRRLEGGSTEA